MNKYKIPKESMPTVPLHQLRNLTNKLSHFEDDTDITLQLVLASLFPTVWHNIQKYSNDCYTKGYLQGLEDSKKNEN